ncbi:hypothetical protein NSQ29_17090 [Paenibacillus sp. FSL F4-0236]
MSFSSKNLPLLMIGFTVTGLTAKNAKGAAVAAPFLVVEKRLLNL